MRLKNSKGITLIALIVTIIVLLILVGVTLNLVGEDGIIAQAKWSAYVTEYEAVDEQKEMYATTYYMDKYSGNKKVSEIYKTAALSTVAKTTEEKIAIYPVSDKLDVDSMCISLKESIKYLENLQDNDLGNKDLVNLYQVDFSKIEADAKKSYAINIVSGMLYSIEYEEHQGKLYHTPRYGIASGLENEKIDRNITETGTYEIIVDADQIVSWDSVVIQYYKHVEGSLSMKVYSSDDEINWVEEMVGEPTISDKKETHSISSANRTQYLKVEITIEDVNGENSELDYILVNFYKFRKVDKADITIETTDASENNGIYTVSTPSNGEASGTATVTQTITVPTDADEYMINIEEFFGNPSISVTIDGTTTYTDLDVEELKKIEIKPGSTVVVETTLNAGDGIGKVELLAKESNLSSGEKKTTANEKEIAQDWRTVEQKKYMYNNGGTGFWEKCLVNDVEVDKTGIIIESEDAVKRIMVRYQVSSDGNSWSGYFTNIEEAENTQFLRVVVDYQVFGDIEYGDTSNNKIKVILNEGYWTATFQDTDGTVILSQKAYYIDSTKQAKVTTLATAPAKEGKQFLDWLVGSTPIATNTEYTMTGDTVFEAEYMPIDIYTVADLTQFREFVNRGITYEGLTVNLMNDLNLSSVCSAKLGVSWTPIADYGTNTSLVFAGIFNGNNHTISNLYINNSKDWQGLFGYITGEIQKLNIYGNMTFGGNSGTICAGNDSGKIENCTNYVVVEGHSDNVGGICGINYNKGTVKYCKNYAKIQGKGSSLGGIVGWNFESNISYCSNLEEISTLDATNSTGGIVGGLDGQSGCKVEFCYNAADIKASNASWNCGGIIGGHHRRKTSCRKLL